MKQKKRAIVFLPQKKMKKQNLTRKNFNKSAVPF